MNIQRTSLQKQVGKILDAGRASLKIIGRWALPIGHTQEKGGA